MPREHRKRGKKRKAHAYDTKDEQDACAEGVTVEEPHLEWMQINDEMNLAAPFGYVDPDVKGYFRTVDSQIQDWQSQGYGQDLENVEGNTNEGEHVHRGISYMISTILVQIDECS